MDGSTNEYPSPSTIEKIRRNPNPTDEALQNLIERSKKIAEQQRFFHWELEFPEIFAGSSVGFDCILGNPPWDKVKLEEREWFAGKAPKISESGSKRQRNKLIKKLKESKPEIHQNWKKASKRASQTSKFIRESGRYPLSGSGEINTYPVFTELAAVRLINHSGRMGMVVKTGLATDYGTQDLFSKFIDENRLISLYDFVNEEGIFPDVAPPERFCLLTVGGSNVDSTKFTFSFFNTSMEMCRAEERRYELTQEQIQMINPNTKSCPTFPDSTTRNISLKIYEGVPVLVNDREDSNPWGIKYHRMYDMTSDSDKFEENTLENLKNSGYSIDEKNTFEDDNSRYFPLYEAKFIHHFDHRFGSFENIDEDNRFTRKAKTVRVQSEAKSDPTYEITPRYWVKDDELNQRIENLGWSENWIFTFRDVTNTTTNFRTAIGTIAPLYGFSNKAPILTFQKHDSLGETGLLFTSFFTSFVFDFVLRQSIGGASLNLYILKQLPMPKPEDIKSRQINIGSETESLENFLVEHALHLTWTSHSLDSLGETLGNDEGPFIWEEDERRERRAKIDAAIAHIYGLSKGQFEYILESFDILKEREVNNCGEYRRKRECLKAFDEISLSGSK
jgi:hypothetical protein